MKNGIVYNVLLLVCVSIISCAEPGKKERPALVTQKPAGTATANSKPLYQEKCALCHGNDGTAGISDAANLQKSTMDTISVIRMITHGKNAMPAFSDQLGTGEIEQIADYVFTLRQ